MLIGMATLAARGTAGAMLYLLGHAFVKGALFMSAGLLLNRFESLDEEKLRGKGRGLPVLTFTMITGGLGLAGFPPFGTYLGKQLIEEAGAHFHQPWLTGLFLLTSALTGGAVLRVVGTVFFARPAVSGRESKSASASHENREIGAGPHRPGHHADHGGSNGGDPGAFRRFRPRARDQGNGRQPAFRRSHRLLSCGDRRPTVRPAACLEQTDTTLRGILFGIAGAVGAVMLALVNLFKSHIPNAFWRGWKPWLDRVLALLQRLQSGHVGDYVLWLMIGVVFLATALLLSAKISV